MNKKILFALLALILIVVVVMILISQKKNPNAGLNNNNTNQNNNQNQNPANPAAQSEVNVYTTSATVKSISGSDMIVTVPVLDTGRDGLSRFINQEKKVNVTNETQYFFTAANGTRSPAKLTDVKPNVKVSITGSQDLTKNSTATATIIEILK